MPKIREVKCYGYYRVEREGKKKTRYVYTRKAYYFPVAFEKQLNMFKGVELYPHLEEDKIVLEPRKRRAKSRVHDKSLDPEEKNLLLQRI